MKIIDEKGKLFGKINVIDFLVIIFFLFLTPMFYFGYKLFNKPAVTSEDDGSRRKIYLDVYCMAHYLSPEMVRQINVGDQYKAKGEKAGEILSVGEPETDTYVIKIEKNKVIYGRDQRKKQLKIKIRLSGEIIENTFHCLDGQGIDIGTKIDFRTDKYKIKCSVESIETVAIEGAVESGPKPIPASIIRMPSNLETVELNVSFKPLKSDTLKLILVGDVFIDEAGNELGEILNLGTPSIYSYSVELQGGQTFTRADPTRRELPAKVRIYGEMKGKSFYYRGDKANMGAALRFKTDKYAIEGIIESEPSIIHRQEVLFKARFKDIVPEVADLVKAGDVETEYNGEVICRVKSVITNEKSKLMVSNKDGSKFIAVTHPENRDLVLLMEANCIKRERGLLFKKDFLKVGKKILFSGQNYDIEGAVIAIENTYEK